MGNWGCNPYKWSIGQIAISGPPYRKDVLFLVGGLQLELKWATKKRPYFPLYWLFNGDPYNGLLKCLHNWVGFHPLYTANNQGDHCSSETLNSFECWLVNEDPLKMLYIWPPLVLLTPPKNQGGPFCLKKLKGCCPKTEVTVLPTQTIHYQNYHIYIISTLFHPQNGWHLNDPFRKKKTPLPKVICQATSTISAGA